MKAKPNKNPVFRYLFTLKYANAVARQPACFIYGIIDGFAKPVLKKSSRAGAWSAEGHRPAQIKLHPK